MDAFDSEESDVSVVVIDTPPKMKTDSDMDISNEKKTEQTIEDDGSSYSNDFFMESDKEKIGKNDNDKNKEENETKTTRVPGNMTKLAISSESMKENYSPKECEKEIDNVIKENAEEGVELTAEEKKVHKLFGQLTYTVRLWPFDDEDNFGKNRDGKDFYEFDETRYRLNNKVGETDQLMNIQELFIESAIDDPGMFEGYTHFNDNVGFYKQKRDEDIDKFMECVKLIEPKQKSSDKGNLCYPHPKWLELRRRIDNAERDNKGRWDVKTVFKEAAEVTDFGKWKQGKHYLDGIGFVETTNEQKGKEDVRVREIQTRSTSDTKQDAKMKDLINTIRGYPFGEKNMLGKDRNNSSKQFNKENEFVYRVQDATGKIKDEESW